jgi:DNA polymerase
MSECVIDSETRSDEPISHGTDKYMTGAESIIWTFAVDDDPIILWDRSQTNYDRRYMHPELGRIIADPSINFVAHNAPFDRAAMIETLGIYTPVERWRCTRAQAYSHGLPGALETLPAVLGLPPNVAKFAEEGKRLIHIFCIPYRHDPDGTPHYYDRHTHPAEWFDFCQYGIQDTRSLRAVRRALPTSNYQGDFLHHWWLDQLVNNRGFGFDTELATAARELLDKAKAKLAAGVAGATDNAVMAPTQREKLLRWLEAKGFEVPNLRAATVREMLDNDDLDPIVRFVLEARLEAAKASGAKYGRGLSWQVGGRMRHAIQFSGAGRTSRFSHKGFQPGNTQRPVTNGAGKNAGRTIPVDSKYILEMLVPGIKQGLVLNNPLVYDQPHTACANAVRCAIIAAPGNTLMSADFSGIEARGAAWVADETWLLEAYRAGDKAVTKEEKKRADTYRMLFSRFFGIPLDEVNDHERNAGKVVKLSMQYGAGVGGLVTMSATYNLDLDTLVPVIMPRATPTQLKKAEAAWRRAFLMGLDYGLSPDTYRACDVLKQVYRDAEKRITQVRYDIDGAVRDAMTNPGVAFYAARCTFFASTKLLTIVLPSGRRLLYWQPRIDDIKEVDPETLEERVRKVVTFLTPRGKSWIREKAWSGMFLNNIVQGICTSDILKDAMRALHADTLTVDAIVRYLHTLPPQSRTAISLHVHDDIVLDVPRDSYPLERMIRVMTSASRWAVGFPIVAEGWVNPTYHKK